MNSLIVCFNRYMLITMIMTTVVVVVVVGEVVVVVEGVKVLRERLTRRVVKDLNLITEISSIR
jgi:hypothetical protein